MARRRAKAVVPDEVKDQAELRAEMDANLQTYEDLGERRLQMLNTIARELPADRDLLVEQTKFYLAQGAVAFIEVGRRLVALKESVEHGDWKNILDELNIGPTTAYNAMRVAQKFSNLNSMLHLTPSKLVALLDVPQKELEQAEKSGTVLGMPVDAVDAMTVRQLREKLREERKRTEKGAEQLRSRDDENRKLKDELREIKVGPKTDLEMMQQLQEIQNRANICVQNLRTLASHVRTEAQRDALIGTVLHVEKSIMLLAHDVQRSLDPTDDDVTDAGRQWLETKPDGIHWFEASVFDFLREATRKARGEEEEHE